MLLYWKLRKSGFTTRKVNATMLTNLAKSSKLTVADIVWQSPITILRKIRQASRDFASANAHAQDLRTDYLRERAALQAATHSMSEHAACASIEACERSSRQFCQLRTVFNPGASYGLDCIDVPNSFEYYGRMKRFHGFR
jgi:hypothetical protein